MSRTVKRTIQKLGRGSVNRLAKWALTRGIEVPPLTSDRLVLLEVPGRRSGIVRTTPMGFAPCGDPYRIHVVAEHGRRSDWVRNALAAGSVKVILRGQRYRGRVRILDGADPQETWSKMKSLLVVASAQALAHDPVVVEIQLARE